MHVSPKRLFVTISLFVVGVTGPMETHADLSEALVARQADVSDAPEVTRSVPAFISELNRPSLPTELEDEVIDYLVHFHDTKGGRSNLSAVWERGHKVAPTVFSELEAAKLPRELVCVPFVESGFRNRAKSHKAAVGMWQFVKITAKERGLKVSRWVDERQDPIKATRAAVTHLGYLYKKLKNWNLALAAYNMGYGALSRSMREFNSNDFWALAKLEGGLPFETVRYAAKIQACAFIVQNPASFGLEPLGSPAPVAAASEVPVSVSNLGANVEVPGGTSLKLIAKITKIDLETLQTLNSELRRGRTPPGKVYTLRVPAAEESAARIAMKRSKPQLKNYATYRFRFGDRVDQVAKRYRITAKALRALNELLVGERPLPGSELIVPAITPKPDAIDEKNRALVVPVILTPAQGAQRVVYEVASGDVVGDVANFFGVTTGDIESWNSVRADAALPEGMRLQLLLSNNFPLENARTFTFDMYELYEASSEKFAEYRARLAGKRRIKYTAKEGDTMRSVAKAHKLRLGDVARINNLPRRAELKVGDEVILYVP